MTAMTHLPVNHRLRQLYRLFAGAAGVYVLIFGILGLRESRGMDFFQHDDLARVMGLTTNPAFAYLSVGAGALVVLAALVGRNIDQFVNFVAGLVFLVAGLAMLTLLRTDLNILGFSVTNCVLSFLLGLIMLTAGLYGRIDERPGR